MSSARAFVCILFLVCIVEFFAVEQILAQTHPISRSNISIGVKQQHSSSNRTLIPIPMLSISLNIDKNHYLKRLLESIDHPIDLISIQVGNADRDVLNSILEVIQVVKFHHPLLNIQAFTLNENPGSANGFNFGLRQMLQSKIAKWVLVVNSDIAFYPGVLRRFSRHVEKALLLDSKFGIGFTSLCCGGEWSAVAFTRRLVNVVGQFDENFYPAYYEDDDYGIRVHLSGLHAVKFDNTPLLHGEIDGSNDYLSGIFSNLYMNSKLDAATMTWKRTHEAGVKLSQQYIEAKWGIQMGNFKSKNKLDCKSIAGINQLCHTQHTHPFNNPTHNISTVLFNQTMRDVIMKAGAG